MVGGDAAAPSHFLNAALVGGVEGPARRLLAGAATSVPRHGNIVMRTGSVDAEGICARSLECSPSIHRSSPARASCALSVWITS